MIYDLLLRGKTYEICKTYNYDSDVLKVRKESIIVMYEGTKIVTLFHILALRCNIKNFLR